MANLHLTQNERYQIYALRKAGHSIRTMAAHLGRSPSTISRELRRNRGRRGYRPAKAHEIACRRALRSRRQVRIDASQWQLVETLLRLHWSPEQIAHRTRLEGTLSISHEWIYRYIRADRARGGRLWKHLRQAHRRRRR